MFSHQTSLTQHRFRDEIIKSFSKESRADLMPIRLTFPVTGPALSNFISYPLCPRSLNSSHLASLLFLQNARLKVFALLSVSLLLLSTWFVPACLPVLCSDVTLPVIHPLTSWTPRIKLPESVSSLPHPHCIALLSCVALLTIWWPYRCLMCLLSVSYTTELRDGSDVDALLYCPSLVQVLAHNRCLINIYWTNEWVLSEK